MGLLDRIKIALGFEPAEQLVEFPERFAQVGVDKLHVHTANLSPDTDEKLVIITMPADALPHLRGAVQLTHPGQRPVTWVPVGRPATPVLDPNEGWIIPVTPATAEELAALPAGPGEHELATLHLGLILE